MKKIIFLILLLIPFNVYAEEAKNLSKSAAYTINNSPTYKYNDDNIKTYNTLSKEKELRITSNDKISHVYIIYELSSKAGTLKTDNEEISLGTNGYLHEYQELTVPSNTLTLTYNEDVKINEIKIYGEGDIPKDVQKWTTEDKADLMIFSTHADDEQLFFAGVMPTYINQDKKVHVVYLARHDIGAYYNPSRMHEQLNGLWALGVTDYPTFGLIPDAFSEGSNSLATAEAQIKQAGFTTDDIIKFDVTEIRKYKPKVILGHDVEGEYGHGQHKLNTSTLKQAIEKSKDSNYIIEGLEAYDVPKVYLHLYDLDNKTVLDYDVPLEKYDGKTAYQVSKEGYKMHLSQQYTWFTNWLNGKNNSYTSATQITKYNPAYWGLYYTTVGPDVNKNDLFENIVEEKEIENNDNKKTKVSKVEPVSKFKRMLNRFILKTNLIVGSILVISIILIILIKVKKHKNKKATK